MSEPYKFSCPHCDGHITATPEWYGKVTQCPHCSQSFEVPYPIGVRQRVGAVPDRGYARTQVMKKQPPRHGPPGGKPDHGGQSSTPASRNRGAEGQSHSVGMNRAGYWGVSIALGVAFWGVLFGLGQQSSGAALMGLAVLGTSLVVMAIQVILARMRLSNAVLNPGLAFLLLVPVVNLFIQFRCLVSQEGYGESRKLDGAGKILVVLFVLSLVISTVGGGLAVSSVFNQTRSVQAQKTATEFRTGISNYYSEYKRFPLSAGPEEEGPMLTDGSSDLVSELVGKNPRGIRFFTANEAPTPAGSGLFTDGSTSRLNDPWGNPFYVVLDSNYDNKITVPSREGDGSTEMLINEVGIWSSGPDGVSGNGDDIRSY